MYTSHGCIAGSKVSFFAVCRAVCRFFHRVSSNRQRVIVKIAESSKNKQTQKIHIELCNITNLLHTFCLLFKFCPKSILRKTVMFVKMSL